MPFFVKTEIIKKDFIINSELKKKFIAKHILWIKDLKKAGVNIKSGFLVNEIKEPGAGGLLIIEVKNFKDALNIVLEDPLVKNKIVDWKLSERVDISKE